MATSRTYSKAQIQNSTELQEYLRLIDKNFNLNQDQGITVTKDMVNIATKAHSVDQNVQKMSDLDGKRLQNLDEKKSLEAELEKVRGKKEESKEAQDPLDTSIKDLQKKLEQCEAKNSDFDKEISLAKDQIAKQGLTYQRFLELRAKSKSGGFLENMSGGKRTDTSVTPPGSNGYYSPPIKKGPCDHFPGTIEGIKSALKYIYLERLGNDFKIKSEYNKAEQLLTFIFDGPSSFFTHNYHDNSVSSLLNQCLPTLRDPSGTCYNGDPEEIYEGDSIPEGACVVYIQKYPPAESSSYRPLLDENGERYGKLIFCLDSFFPGHFEKAVPVKKAAPVKEEPVPAKSTPAVPPTASPAAPPVPVTPMLSAEDQIVSIINIMNSILIKELKIYNFSTDYSPILQILQFKFYANSDYLKKAEYLSVTVQSFINSWVLQNQGNLNLGWKSAIGWSPEIQRDCQMAFLMEHTSGPAQLHTIILNLPLLSPRLFPMPRIGSSLEPNYSAARVSSSTMFNSSSSVSSTSSSFATSAASSNDNYGPDAASAASSSYNYGPQR